MESITGGELSEQKLPGAPSAPDPDSVSVDAASMDPLLLLWSVMIAVVGWMIAKSVWRRTTLTKAPTSSSSASDLPPSARGELEKSVAELEAAGDFDGAMKALLTAHASGFDGAGALAHELSQRYPDALKGKGCPINQGGGMRLATVTSPADDGGAASAKLVLPSLKGLHQDPAITDCPSEEDGEANIEIVVGDVGGTTRELAALPTSPPRDCLPEEDGEANIEIVVGDVGGTTRELAALPTSPPREFVSTSVEENSTSLGTQKDTKKSLAGYKGNTITVAEATNALSKEGIASPSSQENIARVEYSLPPTATEVDRGAETEALIGDGGTGFTTSAAAVDSDDSQGLLTMPSSQEPQHSVESAGDNLPNTETEEASDGKSETLVGGDIGGAIMNPGATTTAMELLVSPFLEAAHQDASSIEDCALHPTKSGGGGEGKIESITVSSGTGAASVATSEVLPLPHAPHEGTVSMGVSEQLSVTEKESNVELELLTDHAGSATSTAGDEMAAGQQEEGLDGKTPWERGWRGPEEFKPPSSTVAGGGGGNVLGGRNFTVEQLNVLDGSVPASSNLGGMVRAGKPHPIYIALRGKVYDASSGRNLYGSDGKYFELAGHDVSRRVAHGLSSRKGSGYELDDLSLEGLGRFGDMTLAGWEDTFAARGYPVMGRVVAPPPPRLFSRQELKKFDGRPAAEDGAGSLHQQIPPGYAAPPIYVGVKDKVFDVSFGGSEYYVEGGAYECLAGKDASRVLAKMSMAREDVEGALDYTCLTDKESKNLDDWVNKLGENGRGYPVVGWIDISGLDLK